MDTHSIVVQKFGGGLLKDVPSIQQMVQIIQEQSHPSVVVVSAMGKSTNDLEEIVNLLFQQEQWQEELDKFKKFIAAICQNLFYPEHEIYSLLNDLLVELEWALDEDPTNTSYDYVYDQVVGMGELISSRIVASHLQDQGLQVVWMDARDLIKTDEHFRNAKVELSLTADLVEQYLRKEIFEERIVVTQGFIGSTQDNAMTTLGREGSDYTAALLGFLLNVQKVIIWKDVPGIMNGDPAHFEKVQKIEQLSYREIIEMTFFGAKVLHPKTIQPLQNKNIKLFIKSFHEPDSSGSLIYDFKNLQYPPIVVQEKQQILLQITTRDFSFITESHLQHLFAIFTNRRIKINLMRNTAISFNVCLTNRHQETESLIDELQQEYDIISSEDVELITIRHAIPSIVKEMKENRIILLEERFEDTLQIVVRAKGNQIKT